MTSTTPEDRKPFSGYRVLDFTQGVAGPYASMLLALNGADVLKVEPLEGDWARRLGATAGQESINYIAYNRGKRSLAIDLKSEAGTAVMRAALSSSDIVIEAFRPGVADRLGFGHQKALSLRSDVIYASVSGFGQTGPDTGRAAVDTLIQAFSGMMTMNATASGEPHRSGMIIVDALTGMFAYQAVAAAVLQKERFGGGAFLDVSMMQAAAAFQASKIMEFHQARGKLPPLYVPAGTYQTSDGYLVISGMRKEHFIAICTVVGHPEMADDPRWPNQDDRIQHQDEINGKLKAAFIRRPSEFWLRQLADAGVMAERVRAYDEWMEEPQVVQTNAFSWVGTEGFGALPVTSVPGVLPRDVAGQERPAPLIGEQSEEILTALGFDPPWIERQVTCGAVRTTRRMNAKR